MLSGGYVEDQSSLDRATSHAIEEMLMSSSLAVEIVAFTLTFGCRIKRFLEIETGTDDRSSECDPIQNYTEDVERESARRQAVQRHGTAAGSRSV